MVGEATHAGLEIRAARAAKTPCQRWNHGAMSSPVSRSAHTNGAGDTSEAVRIDTPADAAFRAQVAVAKSVLRTAKEAGLHPALVELVNVRVSQLNGCAACLDMHVRQALAAGVTEQQIAVLPAWRDTAVFSEKERAALILAESVTTLPGRPALDQDHTEARKHLSVDEFSAVAWIAITINTFNRISIVSRHIVEPKPGPSSAGRAAQL